MYLLAADSIAEWAVGTVVVSIVAAMGGYIFCLNKFKDAIREHKNKDAESARENRRKDAEVELEEREKTESLWYRESVRLREVYSKEIEYIMRMANEDRSRYIVYMADSDKKNKDLQERNEHLERRNRELEMGQERGP